MPNVVTHTYIHVALLCQGIGIVPVFGQTADHVERPVLGAHHRGIGVANDGVDLVSLLAGGSTGGWQFHSQHEHSGVLSRAYILRS